MNTIQKNAMSVKMAPAHSFHPNAALLQQRKGYVAGVDCKEESQKISEC